MLVWPPCERGQGPGTRGVAAQCFAVCLLLSGGTLILPAQISILISWLTCHLYICLLLHVPQTPQTQCADFHCPFCLFPFPVWGHLHSPLAAWRAPDCLSLMPHADRCQVLDARVAPGTCRVTVASDLGHPASRPVPPQCLSMAATVTL